MSETGRRKEEKKEKIDQHEKNIEEKDRKDYLTNTSFIFLCSKLITRTYMKNLHYILHLVLGALYAKDKKYYSVDITKCFIL